jgi:beta-1,4-mannosyl-glycoprotein beta-1,4-N-acetylglucosaminyltransferase
MTVYDVFNYNGEPIVDARIKYLEDAVDHFVVVEGTHTFTGIKKPALYFDSCSFKDHPKVLFVPVTDVVPGGAWANEAHQRNAGKQIFGDEDLILCSDADEIPNAGMIPDLSTHVNRAGGALLLLQDFYYYNFNWKKRQEWPNAFATTGKVLDTYTIQDFRGRVRHAVKCGWHCSYAETADNIRRKIESFSHTECNRPEFTTDEHLRACLETGKDLFNRPDEDCTYVEESLPPALEAFNVLIKGLQCVK